MSKNNFVFNACMLWNKFENIVFSKIIPDGNCIMVPDSSEWKSRMEIRVKIMNMYGYFLRLRKEYEKVDSATDSSVPVLHPQELSKSSYR